jgi:hypothetical protein
VPSGRHRRPVPGPPAGWPAALTTGLPLLLLTAAAALVSAGLEPPAPLVALGTVTVLGLVGSPLVASTRIPVPDPLTRVVLAVALGLVLISALVAGLDAVRPETRPGPLTCLLVVDGLVVALRLVARWSTGAPDRPPRTSLRAVLPWSLLTALPVLGWLDATGTTTSPGWLRLAVLGSTLVLLLHRHLRTADGAGATSGRGVTAAVLYCVTVAVLTPFTDPGSSVAPDWTRVLASAGGITAGEVERIVLPMLAGVVVVAAWLTAERVLGGGRAVVVATVVLAVLLAAPSNWGDLPVAAAVLLVLAGGGAPAVSALRRRRVAVLVLTVGALVNAPSAVVFAAQLCLAAVLTLLVGRSARAVLTLPLAAGVAIAAGIATVLHDRVDLATSPWTPTALVVTGLAVVGFVAVLTRRSRPAVRDQEFLFVVTAGLLLEVVATVGSSGTVVLTHVLVPLAVPAALGAGTAWSLLAAGLGVVLDRVPDRLLRSPARATAGHRLPPQRLNRTALAALALLALEYVARALD